jgi:pimeloyl-ACP methyl ester carboxylesterase
LIITHGWPGSFLEMLKLIPLLTEPDASGFCFDVVIPSLPGFGFSDKPRTPGMSTARIANIWTELMEALGYFRFSVQGGDFGSGVATFLGLRHADRVMAIHLNYVPGSYMPDLDGTQLTEEERQFLKDRDRWYDENGAYAHVQSREPQTLGCALNDSPAGLAAWILEKFRLWADCHGDLSKRFTRDEMLANVMLYWTTRTITSSCRLYYETRHQPVHFARGERVGAPCAIARFPFESPFPPRSWVERGYNVQRWSEMPTGGHFAAMEEPELLAKDIRAFFSTVVAQCQCSADGR